MNPTIQSFKKNYQTADHYDAIIIGSGMGSLTTAAMLAKEGQRVLILERHYTAGGYTHVFKRRGYEWDVGIHYIGEVQRPKSMIRRLFDYVTDGQLKWADMGDVYDRVVIGDDIYNFVKGVDNFKQQLTEYFPQEAEAIEQYVDLVFAANKTFRNFYMEKAMPPLARTIAGGYLRRPYLKFAEQTTQEVLEGLTSSKQLIKVLTAQYGDYGLPPRQSSFVMHAAVARHYFAGGSFPIGGSSQIVETIAPVLAKTGSTILISADVKQVLIEKNKAIGVEMADGTRFSADRIVSGAGLFTTYRKLLPEAAVRKHKLEEQLQKVRPSVAHACLYIGLEGSPEELQIPKANYWIYPEDGEHDEIVERYIADTSQPFPVVYVSFPAAKDPDWSNRYPGKSTIDIITLLPYEEVADWEGTRWKKRGQTYEEYKENLAQRLLAELYRLEPQLKGKVEYYELSTPLTTKHFVNYERGEIYGLDHSPDRFKNKFLRPHTAIQNFYLTGQDIVTAGVGAALFSGLLTASAMTKKNLVERLFE
ncbi:MAG: NAD(P)/FAD-dependent oxidoreductase [Bacteroidota bacterium]